MHCGAITEEPLCCSACDCTAVYCPAQARLDHNRGVKGDRAASEAARAVYLKRNIDKLRPFVTEQV